MLWLLKGVLPAYSLLIAWLCLTPASGGAMFWDKALHWGAYTVFAVVALPWSQGSRRTLAVLCLMIFAYSGALEVGQHFVPGRQMDALDMLANGLGVATGFGVSCFFLHFADARWVRWLCSR